MELRLIYGLLVALALFAVVWFAFVVPAERRDHERRLAIVRKRLAEREQRRREAAAAQDGQDEEQGDSIGNDEHNNAGNTTRGDASDEPADSAR